MLVSWDCVGKSYSWFQGLIESHGPSAQTNGMAALLSNILEVVIQHLIVGVREKHFLVI